MTVSYSDHFWRLFFCWKGSLWKSIWKELIVFLVFFYSTKAMYKFAMNKQQQHQFERLVPIFNDYTENIPLTFMLGFYVGMVVTRWWDQFQNVSWPDSFLYWVSAYIRGNDAETRLIRRTMARYCVLASVMAWRSISTRVLKRFPTVDHIVTAGLMTNEEKRLYEQVVVKYDPHKQWFVPLNWVLSLLVSCHENNHVTHVNELVQLLQKLETFRNGFIQLFIYDWITIPLVYTQVAVVSTYGYFGLCIIGRQYITTPLLITPLGANMTHFDTSGNKLDLYVPIYTILQFLLYVGWLKVAEDLMNPFGEDDEDFELNYIIDRHLEIAYIIVDGIHGQLPPLVETGLNLSEEGMGFGLPHTRASAKTHDRVPRSHVRNIVISPSDMEFEDRSVTDEPESNTMPSIEVVVQSPKHSPGRLTRSASRMKKRSTASLSNNGGQSVLLTPTQKKSVPTLKTEEEDRHHPSPIPNNNAIQETTNQSPSLSSGPRNRLGPLSPPHPQRYVHVIRRMMQLRRQAPSGIYYSGSAI